VLDGGGTENWSEKAFIYTADDITISNLWVKRYRGYGVGTMQEPKRLRDWTGETRIMDCIAEDVMHNQSDCRPGCKGGTAEANFWFANRTHASRLRATRSGWMGMFTGSRCCGSTIEDFLLEDFAVGLYIERVTCHTTFRRFRIANIHDREVAGGKEPCKVLRARSITIEHWDGDVGSYNLTFEDGDIYCPVPEIPCSELEEKDEVRAGVYAGPGTYGLTFRRCRFFGPGVALRLPKKRNGPDAVTEDCSFEQCGADRVYHEHGME
jgi:hypothetical protein